MRPAGPPLDAASARPRPKAALGCCGSFGDWKPEIHGIAVPLALGNGLPDMVLIAAGPAISRSVASYLAQVRPRLIDAVQQICGQLGR